MVDVCLKDAKLSRPSRFLTIHLRRLTYKLGPVRRTSRGAILVRLCTPIEVFARLLVEFSPGALAGRLSGHLSHTEASGSAPAAQQYRGRFHVRSRATA